MVLLFPLMQLTTPTHDTLIHLQMNHYSLSFLLPLAHLSIVYFSSVLHLLLHLLLLLYLLPHLLPHLLLVLLPPL
jgi:hypothetical protein